MSISEIFSYFVAMVARLIPILVLLAVVAFMWGIVKFIAHADDEKKIEEGKQFIVWGLIGLFVLVSFWGLIGYIQETIGLNNAADLGQLSEQPSTIPTPP